MQPSYKYFAFISFQSADAREAARLQHTIESYRLPAVLCRQDNTLPRCIKPLYCYLNDMHAGEELMQELKLRMEQSRYLIVVCSPHSARSTYVNSGIDYFVSLGRRDSIIPVIVDGVPYSGNPETECFPEALRRHFPKHADPLQDHSILGINIHEPGVTRRKAYSRAMLMVVARMLHLDFDGLLLREKQRHRRRAILWTCLGVLTAAALCLTWYKAQTVDVALQLEEATPQNVSLPQAQDIRVSLYLEEEVKTDTLHSLVEPLLFRHIPPRFIGRQTRITLTADGYLPVDTIVVLQRQTTLSLLRDAERYGQVQFRLYGASHPERLTLYVADQPTHPDKEGIVRLTIPIANQRPAYPVRIGNQTDSIYMPCGESDIIVYNP